MLLLWVSFTGYLAVNVYDLYWTFYIKVIARLTLKV